MGHMKNYKELIKELPSNRLVCTFGEFQPPSAAHEFQVKAVKKLAEQYRSDHLVLVSPSLKEDYLPADKKVQYMNLMFPVTNIQITEGTIEQSLKELSRKYRSVVLVTSEDLKEHFQKILKKANLPTIEIISAGDTDPDLNKLCESAKKGDYTKFKKGLPSSLRELDSRRLMNDIRQNMGLDMVREEVKFSVDELRDQYFKGEIYHIGEIVESNDTVYQIIKRGSNHLLLQSEDGSKVSKWIQDVKTSTREFMLKEGAMQPTGTDQVVPAPTTPAVAANGIKYKDFKKGLLGKKPMPEIDLDNLDTDEDDIHPSAQDQMAVAAQVAVDKAEPIRAVGGLMHHPYNVTDDNHRRRKINYHLGEEAIDEVSSELLARYKERAKKSAADLSARGKYRQSNDRMLNVMKATGKQIEKTTASIRKNLNKEEIVNEVKYDKENVRDHIRTMKPDVFRRLYGKTKDEMSQHITSEEFELEEGLRHKLAGLAVAGALAASGAAHARVTPNDNTDHSNRFNITHTHQDVKKDSEKKDANAPSHSKEYLKSVVDGSHPRPLITKERAQELLKKHYNEQKNYEEEPTNPNIKLRSGALKHHEKGVKLDTEEGWEDHKIKDQKQPVWGTGTSPKEPLKDIDKVNAAGQEPHPEEWEDYKKKPVKEAQEQDFTDQQVELDDLSDEEIDRMVDSIKDENDIMDVYDDAEFGVIDDESGEEIPEEDKAVKEEAINEVLSRAERMRARVRFAKTKAKRERGVKLALKRSSSSETINKRARRLAIGLMKKRLLRGRSASSLSIGEKERIEAQVAKRKPIINRIAMKLVSRVRQIEKSRLSHHKYTQ